MKMADVSLDDIIRKKRFNRGNNNRQNKGGGGALQLQTKKNQNRGNPIKISKQKQPVIRVTGLGKVGKPQVGKKGFDARQRLGNKPGSFNNPVVDAREKLQQKTKFVDARVKIQNAKAKTTPNKPLDARAKINIAKGKNVLLDARSKIKAKQQNNRDNNPSDNGPNVIVTGLGNVRTSAGGLIVTKMTPPKQEENTAFTSPGESFIKTIRNPNIQESPTGLITKTLKGLGETSPYANAGPTPNFRITSANTARPFAFGVQQVNLSTAIQASPEPMPYISIKNDKYQPPVQEYIEEPETDMSALLFSRPVRKTQEVYIPQVQFDTRAQAAPVIQQSMFARPGIKRPIVYQEDDYEEVVPTRRMKSDIPATQVRQRIQLVPPSVKPNPVRRVPITAPENDVISKPIKVMNKKKAVAKSAVPVVTPDEVISPLQGYSVKVTNLDHIVTQEDIMELFGALGPLKFAKLIKRGTANVVFVRREDALTAVKKYHNRELDGKPMQVTLVASTPPKPAQSYPAPVKKTPQRLGGKPKKSSMKAPVELGLIHKALFKTQLKDDPPSKPTSFTVKLTV
ncbi:unnamed protein product [Owenia fusiformis]|uniref:RRM domain-containing protein n=1 Tax=Owenia fusiformis TaxID=6347 RepID=A0A8S4PNP1_OWEFU|nr:unnamed protein product [Owenia fusiformis]